MPNDASQWTDLTLICVCTLQVELLTRQDSRRSADYRDPELVEWIDQVLKPKQEFEVDHEDPNLTERMVSRSDQQLVNSNPASIPRTFRPSQLQIPEDRLAILTSPSKAFQPSATLSIWQYLTRVNVNCHLTPMKEVSNTSPEPR